MPYLPEIIPPGIQVSSVISPHPGIESAEDRLLAVDDDMPWAHSGKGRAVRSDEHFHPGDPGSLAPLLDHATEFAREAGRVTLSYFGSVLSADAKGDGSPVTRADREAEAVLREAIQGRFPNHAILGEEYGEEAGTEPIRWILDPIDGTRSFLHGVPLYAVLIGVEMGGEPVLGVAHFPALGETIAAGRGLGCRWWRKAGGNPVSAAVSDEPALSRSVALTTDPEGILVSSVGPGWRSLADRAGFVRGWGDAYGHLLVATGRAEVMVDPVLSPWDAAPFLPILEEAGGRFTDLDGRSTIHGGSGISTNGRLHAQVLELLSERRAQ